MRVVNDYGLIRVVSFGDPFNQASDVVVEFRRSADSDWEFYCGFNSLSDDYAYTNAREAAGRAIKSLAAQYAGVSYGTL